MLLGMRQWPVPFNLSGLNKVNQYTQSYLYEQTDIGLVEESFTSHSLFVIYFGALLTRNSATDTKQAWNWLLY
ncbi:unnamed protein product [Musa acuminata subsp. burmannicoides]